MYISHVSALNIFAAATAVASEPPLPIVVTSPIFEIPWKPGIIAIPFSDINLLISGGRMTSLVGHSGAGKSTILNLIPRFYDPQSGDIKIDNQSITEVLTVNGVRFSLADGSWGLIRASSNKPSLVVVTESPTSEERKKNIFNFIDNLLQKTGKIGEYDQKI